MVQALLYRVENIHLVQHVVVVFYCLQVCLLLFRASVFAKTSYM